MSSLKAIPTMAKWILLNKLLLVVRKRKFLTSSSSLIQTLILSKLRLKTSWSARKVIFCLVANLKTSIKHIKSKVKYLCSLWLKTRHRWKLATFSSTYKIPRPINLTLSRFTRRYSLISWQTINLFLTLMIKTCKSLTSNQSHKRTQRISKHYNSN